MRSAVAFFAASIAYCATRADAAQPKEARMARIAATLAMMVLLARTAHADIPGPNGERGPQRPLVLPPLCVASGKPLSIVGGSSDRFIHLRLPRKILADAGPTAVDEPGASATTPGQTAMAGLALSAAAVAAGFWWLRNRSRPVHFGKLAATAAGTLLLSGCWLWRTNRLDDVPQPVSIAGAVCSGEVIIEAGDDDDAIEVLLPRVMAAKFGEDAKAQ
jgi:hypothetical protein